MPHAPLRIGATAALLLAASSPLTAAPPTPELALSISPLHTVDYDQPTKDEIKACKVEPEKVGSASSWVVRTADGKLLRRFSDTNGDNQPDAWCYFKDGLEVYRDVDTNFDRKADQHRWFNTGGMKWGVDKNQDQAIDYWKRISPQEIGEELVEAIKTKDQAAFERLLLSEAELRSLEVSPTLRAQFARRVQEAAKSFGELATRQQTLSASSRYIDFGAARPGAIPVPPGEDGPEAIVYEGASALVETNGKSEQLQLGVLIQAGEAWRLVDAPQIGGENVELSGVFALSRYSSTNPSAAAPPSDKVQELMEGLEKLDARRAGLPPQEAAKLIDQREELLLQLVQATDDPQLREQWFTQLADMYSSAAMEGAYPKGVERLDQLGKLLVKEKASSEVTAHIAYLRIWTDWILQSQNPKLDFARVQDNWVKQLQSFAKQNRGTADAAEACLQLGMTLEFAGETDESLEWYETLAKEYAGTPRGEKGRGAVRRLNSVGKQISLSGPTLDGRSIDLKQLRGKHVLIQYWATWYPSNKTEMAVINQALSKYAKSGFTVLGVNLDSSPADAKAYLAENRYPWPNIYDQDGLEGRLATEMGVMTPPLMILVNDKGEVVNRNVHVSELDAELKRVLR
ncbi:Thiol-disulfide oxidoreductase ResA [Posidoniimonas polymericola]|uniref:Thiol-disulfide oxidoreductase ResA n=1 Tax=Posidoniimonas polymericola TaxID=2528002 RepID=A0A5C5XXZ5_9BACT|nr:TlpA disulfide reductase family protein [Posidoniimonas polymericola]TWT67744.1 Thiol-disulfide oxidoreductase ResA [Posidoniimonas polymericola]